MLLDAQGLNVVYGRTHAVKDVSVQVAEGEIVTVLGANGAGKSSLLRALQGMVTPQQGELQFKGQSVLRQSAAWRVGQGLVLVPEGRQIFVSLTVNDNLLMGAYTRRDDPQREIDAIYERFPNLAARRDMLASVLSGGEQQMLAIGRALVTNPKLLILDEATEGLAPLIREEIWQCLTRLRQAGQTLVVVDKYVNRLVQIADRHLILERGSVAWHGSSAELDQDRSLWHRYLGV
jgi:branched-chain amino acid transport system ATP-binding protein